MPIDALLVFLLADYGIQVGLVKRCEPRLTQRYELQESGEKSARLSWWPTLISSEKN